MWIESWPEIPLQGNSIPVNVINQPGHVAKRPLKLVVVKCIGQIKKELEPVLTNPLESFPFCVAEVDRTQEFRRTLFLSFNDIHFSRGWISSVRAVQRTHPKCWPTFGSFIRAWNFPYRKNALLMIRAEVKLYSRPVVRESECEGRIQNYKIQTKG